MDLNNRTAMVNSGVRVVRDVTGTLNLGTAAKVPASAMPISLRYPSQPSSAELKPSSRPDHVQRNAHDTAAIRAGRSEGGLGILSRSLALAGLTMAWPWSPVRTFVRGWQMFMQRMYALRDICLTGNRLLPASTRG